MTTLHDAPASLARGRSLPIELAAGTRLHLQRGALRIHAAPQWLGARLVMPLHELRDGELHVFETSGWVLLDALADARLAWQAPEPTVSAWQRATTLLAKALRRLLPALRRRVDAQIV